MQHGARRAQHLPLPIEMQSPRAWLLFIIIDSATSSTDRGISPFNLVSGGDILTLCEESKSMSFAWFRPSNVRSLLMMLLNLPLQQLWIGGRSYYFWDLLHCSPLLLASRRAFIRFRGCVAETSLARKKDGASFNLSEKNDCGESWWWKRNVRRPTPPEVHKLNYLLKGKKIVLLEG